MGSDRVGDWLGQGHYRDPQEFVESIPFTETREYVQATSRFTGHRISEVGDACDKKLEFLASVGIVFK